MYFSAILLQVALHGAIVAAVSPPQPSVHTRTHQSNRSKNANDFEVIGYTQPQGEEAEIKNLLYSRVIQLLVGS